MKRQCQNVVSNCVKSMCGKDYMNCYRNRNDVMLAVYDSGNAGFDNSMNRVGGVLDYTIVQGLCASTVKTADACGESLAIAKLGVTDGESSVTAGWGTGVSTIGNAWNNSAKSVKMSAEQVQEKNASGRKICDCENGGTGICADEEGGNIKCAKAHMISTGMLIEKQAINTVFQDVLADVEAEAQAQYKAKLTKEQNVCLAQNSGANPNPTFVWAKVKGKLPKDYATKGMGNNSIESNDLYNSFCRVKVTLMSEDQDVQNLLNGQTVTIQGSKREGVGGALATTFDLFGGDGFRDGLVADSKDKKITGENASAAYFATGDAFTCGSWLSSDGLNKISEMVGAKARKDAGEGSQSAYNTRLWTTLGVGTLGAGLSAWGYDALQSKSSLGGFLNKDLNKTNVATEAKDLVDKARSNYNTALRDKKQATMDTALSYAQQAKSKLVAAGLSDKVSDIDIPSRVSLTTKQGDELTSYKPATSAEYGVNPSQVATVSNLIDRVFGYCGRLASNETTKKQNCESQIALARAQLDVLKGSTSFSRAGETVDLTQVKTALKQAQGILAQSSNYKNDFKTSVDALPGEIDALTLTTIETKGAYAGQTATYGPSSTDWDDNSATLDNAINGLQTACNNISNDADTKASGQKKRVIGDVVAGAAGGIATAALANGIVSSAQKAKYENAENAAVKEWMENIGSKIHCYINGELVGDFGDIVTVNITED